MGFGPFLGFQMGEDESEGSNCSVQCQWMDSTILPKGGAKEGEM